MPAVNSWGIRRGKARGSVPHHSPTDCCTMVASARVLSSHRCSSERARMRRIATASVTRPNTTEAATAPTSPTGQGRPRSPINQAPATLLSMNRWPVVMLSTCEVEYITL